MRNYDTKIDIAIVDILSKVEQLTYRKLKSRIEESIFLNRTISFETFNYHVKNMINSNQIIRHNETWKRGKTIPYSLTPTTNQEIFFGVFNPILPKRKLIKYEVDGINNNINKKRRLAYQTVLFIESIKPSFIFSDSEEFHNDNEMFILNDIVNVRGRTINYGHHFFSNFKVKDARKILMQSINILIKEKVIIQVKIGNEIQFKFVDENLGYFISELLSIFDNFILLRFILSWKLQKANYDVVKWLESLMGRTAVHEFLIPQKKFRNEIRDNFSKKEKTVLKKDLNAKIDAFDYHIPIYLEELRKKYYNLEYKYPFLINTLTESIYPHFLIRKLSKEKIYHKPIKFG